MAPAALCEVRRASAFNGRRALRARPGCFVRATLAGTIAPGRRRVRRRTGNVATVLVIEDEWVVSRVLEQVLASAGHEVALAASLAEARSALAERKFDLVLLDVNLPDASGLPFLGEIRAELGHGGPVLILSGMKQEETVARGLELGADDYVTKPFSPRELLARIARLTRS